MLTPCFKSFEKNFNISNDDNKPIIALAGNPNTGKSTIFNGLTGLRQHTGNWPGKTVGRAEGYLNTKKRNSLLSICLAPIPYWPIPQKNLLPETLSALPGQILP